MSALSHIPGEHIAEGMSRLPTAGPGGAHTTIHVDAGIWGRYRIEYQAVRHPRRGCGWFWVPVDAVRLDPDLSTPHLHIEVLTADDAWCTVRIPMAEGRAQTIERRRAAVANDLDLADEIERATGIEVAELRHPFYVRCRETR